MDVRKLLEAVQSGDVSLDVAEAQLKKLPYEDIGYANIDHHRQLRVGFPEVIFCPGKTDEQIAGIFHKMVYNGTSIVFCTRATENNYLAVKNELPLYDIEHNSVANTIIWKSESANQKLLVKKGKIAVVTAGTADIAVAEEAAVTASLYGCEIMRVYDVGVAGIHRLFARIDDINKANVIIAVAGMEGALASVLGGLVEAPVIAVPTSIGYGASFGGLSALLTMLNSCASGVGVVNIDNGFGAGYLAANIIRSCLKGED